MQTSVEAFKDDNKNLYTDNYISNYRAVRRDVYKDIYKNNYKTSKYISAILARDALVFTQILKMCNS